MVFSHGGTEYTEIFNIVFTADTKSVLCTLARRNLGEAESPRLGVEFLEVPLSKMPMPRLSGVVRGHSRYRGKRPAVVGCSVA